VGFDTDTLEPKYIIGLAGEDTDSRDRRRRIAEDEEPLSGDATRFVPVIVREFGETTRKLQMVDLDDARVSTLQPIESGSLRHFGARTYLSQHEDRGTHLVAYDGETGQVTGEIHHHDVVHRLKVQGDRVWVSTRDEVSALDARTLHTLWTVKPGGPGKGEVVEAPEAPDASPK
jgi:hypothetical protein